MAEPLHILVVVAHPHDFTHCAGTCGIHRQAGDEVTVVSVTDGGQTHNEKLHDELMKPESERDPAVIDESRQAYAAGKADEFRRVGALFGVEDMRVLGYGQPFRLERADAVVETLRDLFYAVRPQVLITQRGYASGRHGHVALARDDHNETAIAVLEAKQLAAMPDHEGHRQPHTVAVTYYMGVYFTQDEIDFFVDISAWRQQRVQAELLFESQGHTEAFAQKRVEIGAGTMGWHAHTEYAEGYVRAAPEVLPRLIVPEIALRAAREPRQVQMQRVSGEVGGSQTSR